MKRRFVVGAAAIFLLFVGWGVYPILYPVRHWNVECFIRHKGERVFAPRMTLPKKHLAEDFAALSEKRGETCSVMPVRSFRYFLDEHAP